MKQDKDILLDKFQGCLLGLAIGDAVGTTLEFSARGTFEPISEMIGGGPFGLKPGQWTDDTSMALCLAHSLLHCDGFDPEDQMNRYCNWWQWGYMSSNGECFDIGITVSSALNTYLETKNPFSGSVDPYSAGNGSLMRLAPVPMYFYPSHNDAIKYSAESSRTTHGAAECMDACKYFSSILFTCFHGTQKDQLLNQVIYTPQTPKIKAMASGSFIAKSIDEIKGSGYVVESLEAALWCFFNTDDFRSSILAAANLGDDADTTAAICGQVSGAYYGRKLMPQSWVSTVYDAQEIARLASMLADLG